MSIVAILATQSPAIPDLKNVEVLLLLAIVVGWTIAALILAVRIGVLRPGNVVGPARIEPSRPAWPILLVLLVGAGIWFFASNSMGAAVVLRHYHGHRPKTFPTDITTLFKPGDWAVLATLPPLTGLLALLLGDRMVGRNVISNLGLSPRRVGPGLGAGLVGAVIILPLTLVWLSIGLQMIYKQVHFEHPGEHELLRMMTETHSLWIRWALTVGAVVCAPLFEETLFRGHLQTLIREWLIRRFAATTTHPDPRADIPLESPPPPPGVENGNWLPPPIYVPERISPRSADASISPRGRPWQSWVAILITSALFASIHPLWTAPLIFLLAIGLGYVYERTGNLWASITVHALFNAASTALVLLRP